MRRHSRLGPIATKHPIMLSMVLNSDSAVADVASDVRGWTLIVVTGFSELSHLCCRHGRQFSIGTPNASSFGGMQRDFGLARNHLLP